MPRAVAVLNETVSADLPDADKYALLASWDAVLGLDLERLAREGFEVPAEVQAMLDERDAARAAKDFAKADEIRARLAEMGWEVMDLPDGTTVRPLLDR
jgi:cysteinyl-tRNA synthetase